MYNCTYSTVQGCGVVYLTRLRAFLYKLCNLASPKNKQGYFLVFYSIYCIQYCFICRLSDSLCRRMIEPGCCNFGIGRIFIEQQGHGYNYLLSNVYETKLAVHMLNPVSVFLFKNSGSALPLRKVNEVLSTVYYIGKRKVSQTTRLDLIHLGSISFTARLDIIHIQARSHPHRLDLIHFRLDLIHIGKILSTSRLDLIHSRLDLIHSRLDLTHIGQISSTSRLDLILSRIDLIHIQAKSHPHRLDLIHFRLDLIHIQARSHPHFIGQISSTSSLDLIHTIQARSHPHLGQISSTLYRLDLIHIQSRSHPQQARSHPQKIAFLGSLRCALPCLREDWQCAARRIRSAHLHQNSGLNHERDYLLFLFR